MKRLLMVTLLAALACGDDSTGPPEPTPPSVTGTWSGTLANIITTGGVETYGLTLDLTEASQAVSGTLSSDLFEDPTPISGLRSSDVALVLKTEQLTLHLYQDGDLLDGRADFYAAPGIVTGAYRLALVRAP